MLFAKRKWALRVTERMGLDPREPVTIELVDMIILGAKLYQSSLRQVGGPRLTAPELVLMSVAAMSDNKSAFDRLTQGRFDAATLLADAREAGRQLAQENGFHTLVDKFYNRLPEVSAEVLRSELSPADELQKISSKYEGQRTSQRKRGLRGWVVPLIIAAAFSAYHVAKKHYASTALTNPTMSDQDRLAELRSLGDKPTAIDPRNTGLLPAFGINDSQWRPRIKDSSTRISESEIATLLNRSPPDELAASETTQRNFIRFKLPRSVEVDLPRGWWLLGSDLLKTMATSIEAAMDLSNFPLTNEEVVTLVAANSMPASTYAAVRIDSVRPPALMPDQLASLTEDALVQFREYFRREFSKTLRLQGNQLIEVLSVRVDRIAGHPAVVIEFRRTGPKGPVWVQLNQVYTETQELRINLSYREAETALWKPVILRIRQSIAIRG